MSPARRIFPMSPAARYALLRFMAFAGLIAALAAVTVARWAEWSLTYGGGA